MCDATSQPEPSIPPCLQMQSTHTCPGTYWMTTHVALNTQDVAGSVLLTMQTETSFAKTVSYRSITNNTISYWQSPWTTSSTASFIYSSAVSFFGSLAVFGAATILGTMAGAASQHLD